MIKFNRKIKITLDKIKLLYNSTSYSSRVMFIIFMVILGTKAGNANANVLTDTDTVKIKTEQVEHLDKEQVELNDAILGVYEESIEIVNNSAIDIEIKEEIKQEDTLIEEVTTESEEVTTESEEVTTESEESTAELEEINNTEDNETAEPHEPIYTITSVEQHNMFTTCGLNLRSGPGTEYDILSSVDINTELIVIGECNGWSVVIYNDYQYFCYSNYLSTDKTIITSVESSPYDNFVIGEDGVTADIVSYANSYWNKNVPNSIKAFLAENDWRVVISVQSLRDRFGYSFSTAGVTEGIENTIYLDNRTSAINTAMLHEIGHAIDFSLGFPHSAGSFCSEFKEIYDAEKDYFIDVTGSSDYARSNPQEFFASVFSNIILSPSSCRSQCPKTVAYIEQYIP